MATFCPVRGRALFALRRVDPVQSRGLGPVCGPRRVRGSVSHHIHRRIYHMLSTIYSWLCRSTQAATTSLDNALVGPILAMFGVQTNHATRVM